MCVCERERERREHDNAEADVSLRVHGLGGWKRAGGAGVYASFGELATRTLV